MISSFLQSKLKLEYLSGNLTDFNDILIIENDFSKTGDNNKYMKMYDRLSYGYDFAENLYDKLKGHRVSNFRKEMMQKLEWKNNLSVLCVSVGTGKDLLHIPDLIDKKSLDVVGLDISLGMLKQCKKKLKNKYTISLVNCSAEQLPFKDECFDIVFHVGGINFFNDKAFAVKEMLRVSKTQTKLLIADETNDYIQSQYQKNIFSKKYFKDAVFDLSEIEKVIPGGVKEKETSFFLDKKFYCITFRK